MPDPTPAEPVVSAASVGAARVIALAYGFFTLAAGARSGVQLATKYSYAPMAYLLSAVAAVIYLLGLIAMLAAERVPARRLLARRVCMLELSGVVIVGTASLVVPSAFPDATVWSGFGVGYAFVPVALPLCALVWTYRHPIPAGPGSGDDRRHGAPARRRNQRARWDSSCLVSPTVCPWLTKDRGRSPSPRTKSCRS